MLILNLFDKAFGSFYSCWFIFSKKIHFSNLILLLLKKKVSSDQEEAITCFMRLF